MREKKRYWLSFGVLEGARYLRSKEEEEIVRV